MIDKKDYLRMLEEGHITTDGFSMLEREGEVTPDDFHKHGRTSRLEYLAENIFNFATYETKYAELFAKKALEVCLAISAGSTFEYIKDAEGRLWYLLMVNTTFFVDKLDWGSSIRGAWWAEPVYKNKKIEFSSCGLFLDGRQIDETLEFTADEWCEFIDAVIEFGVAEFKPNSVKI